ncbi:MAG: DUF2723 domain-containing protein [Anaerolineales bacterium]|nr:DUF2723 domain-containing protein [Anaerolineales bacterium]
MRHTRTILIGILAISLMGLYLSSIAPGLTWANYGSDGGDLIAAAATGGVAHPSGYPLYLLLARLFQFLPIGSLAFRTNLLSAVTVTLAALLVFELTARSLPLSSGQPNWSVGLASAYAFGLAPLVWSQAVITEVYGVQVLFVVVILFLSSVPLPSPFTPHRLDLCLGLAFGLGMGIHLTTILLLPLLFSALPESQPRFPSSLRRIGWMGAGLLVYLTLPLRALREPPINWGNPVTLDGFRWLVTAGPYQDQLLTLNSALVWERLRVVAALLLDQAGLPGLILAALGMVFFFKSGSLHRNAIWMMAAFSAFAVVYGTPDSFVYLLPVCLGFSIWIGIGLAGIMPVLPQRLSRLGPYLSPGFILFLFLLIGNHLPLVDASRDLRAETFGREVLARAPQDAIIFARGDKAIFTMWYFHFALKERPDAAIVATELLGFDWYQQTLHATYPELELPGPFPFAERLAALNPARPVCFVEYMEEARIQCRAAVDVNSTRLIQFPQLSFISQLKGLSGNHN